jgi:hypothetical protein
MRKMKRILRLPSICLITAILVLSSCTQNVPEAQPIAKTETTTASASMPAPPKPAEFIISDLTITPNEVISGASVTIKVTVINIGKLSSTYEVNLKIDYAVQGTEKVTLDGGASQNVTFRVTKWTARTYSVSIDGQSGTLMVKSTPPSPVVTPPAPPLPAMDAFMKGIAFNDEAFKEAWLVMPRPPRYGPLY